MAGAAHGKAKVPARCCASVVICLLVAIAAVGALAAAFATGNLCITSAERLPDRYDGPAIPVSTQASDRDGDGISDGEDILQGALGYTATRPGYRSAYYQGGYPTDGRGVCTDVVAAACRAAGYDLRVLVDADIREHPGSYADGASPDPYIDYRRVRNLRVYFRHTATSLTTDIARIERWQPGDIVLFPEHIGVVSDRRDAAGVPYLIHHANPFQLRYEEDVLASYGDITDHFRLP